MPRSRSLTPAIIAKAAITVIGRDGLPALSMRSIAAELGMSTMALYRYVDGREQVESLVVDLVLERIDIDVTRCDTWGAKVAALAVRARNAVSAHPALVPLLLARRQASPNSLRWGEAVLKALAEGGFSGESRVIAFRTLLSYTLGAVQAEHLSSLGGAGTSALTELPRADYPYVAETAVIARGITSDVEFLSGLQIILNGLAERRELPSGRSHGPGRKTSARESRS